MYMLQSTCPEVVEVRNEGTYIQFALIFKEAASVRCFSDLPLN